MKKGPVIGIVVLVLALGGFILLKNRSASENLSDSSASENASVQTTTIDPNTPVKEFTVDGTSFAFNPSTISVNKGDTVKITFKDNDGKHDLVVDDYNVRTNIINKGSQDSITFVADKSGSFEYYCSVGNHKEQGMTGTLIVKDVNSGS